MKFKSDSDAFVTKILSSKNQPGDVGKLNVDVKPDYYPEGIDIPIPTLELFYISAKDILSLKAGDDELILDDGWYDENSFSGDVKEFLKSFRVVKAKLSFFKNISTIGIEADSCDFVDCNLINSKLTQCDVYSTNTKSMQLINCDIYRGNIHSNTLIVGGKLLRGKTNSVFFQDDVLIKNGTHHSAQVLSGDVVVHRDANNNVLFYMSPKSEYIPQFNMEGNQKLLIDCSKKGQKIANKKYGKLKRPFLDESEVCYLIHTALTSRFNIYRRFQGMKVDRIYMESNGSLHVAEDGIIISKKNLSGLATSVRYGLMEMIDEYEQRKSNLHFFKAAITNDDYKTLNDVKSSSFKNIDMSEIKRVSLQRLKELEDKIQKAKPYFLELQQKSIEATQKVEQLSFDFDNAISIKDTLLNLFNEKLQQMNGNLDEHGIAADDFLMSFFKLRLEAPYSNANKNLHFADEKNSSYLKTTKSLLHKFDDSSDSFLKINHDILSNNSSRLSLLRLAYSEYINNYKAHGFIVDDFIMDIIKLKLKDPYLDLDDEAVEDMKSYYSSKMKYANDVLDSAFDCYVENQPIKCSYFDDLKASRPAMEILIDEYKTRIENYTKTGFAVDNVTLEIINSSDILDSSNSDLANMKNDFIKSLKSLNTKIDMCIDAYFSNSLDDSFSMQLSNDSLGDVKPLVDKYKAMVDNYKEFGFAVENEMLDDLQQRISNNDTFVNSVDKISDLKNHYTEELQIIDAELKTIVKEYYCKNDDSLEVVHESQMAFDL